MRSFKYSVLFLMFSCFVTSIVWADDGFFGGQGDTVFPSTKTNVRMVSETVHLKYKYEPQLDRDEGCFSRGTIYADCDFEFAEFNQ